MEKSVSVIASVEERDSEKPIGENGKALRNNRVHPPGQVQATVHKTAKMTPPL
jgi:hypothetical protein